jgi:hypothetical protein
VLFMRVAERSSPEISFWRIQESPRSSVQKDGPDAGLCGGRLELGRHLAQELISVAMIDWRGQREQ